MRPRRSTSSPTPGEPTTSGRATSSSRRSSSTTRTSCRGRLPHSARARPSAILPVDDDGELRLDLLDETVAGGAVTRRRGRRRLERARHDQPGRADRRLGARPGRRSSWSTQRSRRRTSASTCRRSTSTSSRSPRHKLCGPSGIGALWGRAALLQEMRPFLYGGHMIASRRGRPFDLGRAAPQVRGRHGADGRGRRLRRRDRLPRGRRARRDRSATSASSPCKALGLLGERPWVRLYGPPAERTRRDRLVRRRGRPPARRRADPRLRGRRDPRRPPLLPAAHAAPRRPRDEPRQLLPVHDPGGRRPARRRRGRREGAARMSEFEQLYREVILDHYKTPAEPRPPRPVRRRRGREEPALRRRGHGHRQVRRGRRDRRGRVRGPGLRDQPGRDVDAHRPRQGPHGRRGRRDAEGRAARGDRDPAHAGAAQVRDPRARRPEGGAAPRQGHAAPRRVGHRRPTSSTLS